MSVDEEEDDDVPEFTDPNRFIPEDEAKSQRDSAGGHHSTFQCPVCGSWNTYQSTYADVCNTCGDSTGY